MKTDSESVAETVSSVQSGILGFRRRSGDLEVVLVTARRSDAWTIPMGRVERDAGPLASAVMEAMEQAGVTGDVYAEPVVIDPAGGQADPTAVQIYLMEVTEMAETWPESDIRRRDWMSVHTAAAKIRNEHLLRTVLGLEGILRSLKDRGIGRTKLQHGVLPAPVIVDVREAARRILPHAHRTPVLTSSALNGIAGANISFKCENFQRVGAFKFRGACNAVFALSDEEARRGVASHSSGNHAAALALAARLRGIPAHIVMPVSAPDVKRAAVAGYGGSITSCAATLAARERVLTEVTARTGAVVVHPYNNFHVVAGQGTAALELLEEVPDLDLILVPVGGGGLLSGTAVVATAVKPTAMMIAAEPAGAADAARSFREGWIVPSVNPSTIADGLLTSLGTLTFQIIRRRVDDIVTVSEQSIVRAMRLIMERMKIVVEPSSAVPFGALLEYPSRFSGKKIGIILSGGNVDLDHPPWMHAEITAPRA